MIKAYWPDVEGPISNIARRRMPEARLFTLAAVRKDWLSRTDSRHLAGGRTDPRIPGAISISDIRRLAHDTSRADQREAVRSFLVSDSKGNLASVIDKIEGWLGRDGLGEDNIGLPSVLKTSIARGSPEVYLLLMWRAEAYAVAAELGCAIERSILRKRVLGLATALHWFSEGRQRTVQAVAARTG